MFTVNLANLILIFLLELLELIEIAYDSFTFAQGIINLDSLITKLNNLAQPIIMPK